MFKLAKNLTKKDVFVILICFVLIFAQVWLELKMPDYMSEITRLVQTERKQNERDFEKRWIYDGLCVSKLGIVRYCWVFSV